MSSNTQTTTTSFPPSHVHIIGGGLGGLTLARVLQLSNIPVTVYERESGVTARSQGGTLDLHPRSGQSALRMAGLYDQFDAQCDRLADTRIIRGKDGSIEFEKGHGEGPPDDDRPEIDRGALRQILIDSLKPGTIQWGHTLRSITSTQTGAHQLVFEQQLSPSSSTTTTTITAEFVVGADGAWSRTRSILSPAMPHYAGISFVESELLDVDAKHPAIVELVGDGTLFALGDRKAIIVQRNSGGKMKVYIALRAPESWVVDSKIPFDSDPQATRAGLLEILDGWSEGLRDIVRAAEPKFIPRPLVCLDPEMKWEGKEGITLLGDAAHVMSPFAAEGANLAMYDAAELGFALAGKSVKGEEGVYVSVREAVAGYEKGMFARAQNAAKKSALHMEQFFSDQAPKCVADRMRQAYARVSSGSVN
jgi:2-polyprenyl-6-methoxyphenol hydroxylase-like FAD-dependent oxidoreductase